LHCGCGVFLLQQQALEHLLSVHNSVIMTPKMKGTSIVAIVKSANSPSVTYGKLSKRIFAVSISDWYRNSKFVV
jgi:hypothetical protein